MSTRKQKKVDTLFSVSNMVVEKWYSACQVDVDKTLADFDRTVRRTEEELNELVRQTESIVSRRRNGGSQQRVVIPSHVDEEERGSVPLSGLSSMTSESDTMSSNFSSSNSSSLFDDWDVSVEERRFVCVSASFASAVVRALDADCSVTVVQNGEKALLSVDSLARALRRLTDEREEFLTEVLDLMEITRREGHSELLVECSQEI